MTSKTQKKEAAAAPACNKKSCLLKMIFPIVTLCILFLQYKQITKTNEIIGEISESIRNEVCDSYQASSDRHFSLNELESNFSVKLATKSVSENDFVENLLNSMDILESERFKNDEIEMQRRANQYGPLIERGYEKDDRFYIKLSSQEVGYGLYAKADILPNSVIGIYHGTLTHVKPGYTNTDYAWDYGTFPNPQNPEESVEICIDGRTYGTWLRFVNHKEDATANCYAMYVPYKNRWYIVYMARSFIPKDSELFISYGDNYWNARTETHNYEAEPEKAYSNEL